MYDDDLPEIYQSWVDHFYANKDVILTALKIVGLPTALFVVVTISNYFINKKVKSLWNG